MNIQKIDCFEPALLKDTCDDSGYNAILNLKEALKFSVYNNFTKSCLVCNQILKSKLINCSKCNSSAHLKC